MSSEAREVLAVVFVLAVAVAFAFAGAFVVAVPFPLLIFLPHSQKSVISTEAAHSLIVSSAVEKSASLPRTSPGQRAFPYVGFYLILTRTFQPHLPWD